MPQQAHVLYCTAFDEVTKECTAQAWMPAPSLLPPLTTAQALELAPWIALCFCVAWCWKILGRQSRS